MSRYFLCDYCEHAKRLDVFNADCAKRGVMAKRIIGDDQHPHEVCDCYAHAERLRGEDDARLRDYRASQIADAAEKMLRREGDTDA